MWQNRIMIFFQGGYMMKRIIALGFIMFFSVVSVFAVDIDITLPSINTGGQAYTGVGGEAAALAQFTDEANDVLSKFDSMNSLLKGMSNASSYAADGATMRNFMGYKLFSIAVGTMVSGHLPSITSYSDIDNSVKKIEDAQDLPFGVNAQAITVGVGVNMGFLVDGLYLSGKVGSFAFNINDFDIDMFSCGLFANYQLIKPKSLLLVAWKGLQVGTGFVYYSSDISYKTNVVSVSTDVYITAGQATLVYDPEFDAKFSTKGIKVPVDIMTGVRLAVVDIAFGLGIDINVWSDSSLTYKAGGRTYLENSYGVTSTPGYANVSGGTTGGSADYLKAKAMVGLGVSLGPVKIDVPLTYYFDSDGSGINAGVTGAIVW